MAALALQPLHILSGFGLSGASGLNAYIPLLSVGIMTRLGWFSLAPPYDILASWPALILLGVLLIVELIVDKVPGADHVNDVVMTFVRPTAGAALFAASAGHLTHMHPLLGLAIGLIMAGGVHATKATVRPVVNTATLGVGAPIISLIENVIAVAATLFAILAPILLVGLLVAVVWLLVRVWRRFAGPRSRAIVAND